MREFGSLSGYLLVGGATDLVIYALDRVLLAGFRNVATVGLYEGPVRVHNLVRQIHGTLVGVVLPAASRYLALRDELRLRDLLLRGTRYVLVVTVPITITLMVFARPVLTVWLGPKFGVASTALTILISYWLINANWSVAGAMLIALGHARWLARYAWEVAALSLASSLVLTWQLGLDGVVLGTTIPMLLMSPLFLSKILSTLPVTVTSLFRTVWMPAYTTGTALAAILVAVRLSVRIDTVLELMAVLATGPVIYWGIFYSVWTTPGERALCRDLIRGAARRITSPGHRPSIGVTGSNPMPRVTVVVPAHNAADHIEDTLRSVIRQTFTDWEVIVVDDGSTDATVELARGVDARVNVIRNPRRGGPAAARNLAVAAAQGELLALLDADDQMLPTYLEHQVRLFDTEQARDGRVGIVACDALILEQGGLRKHPYSAIAGKVAGTTLETLLRSNPIFISVLVPSEVVVTAGAFEPQAFGVEDHDLWIRVAELGYRIVATDLPLVIYRKHASNISSNKAAMARQSELVYRRALARGNLSQDQRRIARRSLRLQRSVGELEEFLSYPSWRTVPLTGWRRAMRGAAGLAWHALLTPRRWPRWAAAILRGRSTLWRGTWDA